MLSWTQPLGSCSGEKVVAAFRLTSTPIISFANNDPSCYLARTFRPSVAQLQGLTSLEGVPASSEAGLR